MCREFLIQIITVTHCTIVVEIVSDLRLIGGRHALEIIRVRIHLSGACRTTWIAIGPRWETSCLEAIVGDELHARCENASNRDAVESVAAGIFSKGEGDACLIGDSCVSIGELSVRINVGAIVTMIEYGNTSPPGCTRVGCDRCRDRRKWLSIYIG